MIDENLSCKEIKIFAMSKDEPRFKNKAYAYVQREFFLKDLVNEKGKFLYYRMASFFRTITVDVKGVLFLVL